LPESIRYGTAVAHDPLVALLDLPDVAPAVAAAREAVDELYRLPVLRRRGGAVAAEVALRGAVASAALAGSRHDLADVRAGVVTDPVVQGALRCSEALPGLVDRWRVAPRQVLARLHLLAARGLVSDDLLGRPTGELEVAARLDALASLIVAKSEAPPLIRAAVVHGEVLALRAFAGPYDIVARSAARLEMMAGGLDPRGLVSVEEIHLEREPEYVGASGAFATGTRDGVRSWLRHCATAVELGARRSLAAHTDGASG